MRRSEVARTILAVVFGLVLFAGAEGCATAATRAYVRIGPPARVVEVGWAAPAPGFIWIAGFHRWNGRAYVWVPGRWAHDRHGWYWIDGRWR
jgi:WXXGXW repeat (2 copies)